MRTTATNFKATGYFLVAFFLCLGSPARAAEDICPRGYRKIAEIIRTADYEERRGLMSYSQAFGGDFVSALRLLSYGDDPHWIDSGAGFGFAQKEYIEQPLRSGDEQSPLPRLPKPQNARVTAISAREVRELRKSKLAETDRVKVLDDGTFLEKIPNEKIGRADLITDLYGPLSYSAEPDVVLKKYLDLLRTGGKIFIVTSGGTSVKTPGGDKLLDEWIETIPGLKVKKSGSGLMIERDHTTPLKIPKLKLKEARESVPPLRTFEIES